MLPEAVHKLNDITSNVTPSEEGEKWNKILKQCFGLKMKITKCHSTVLLLKKLRNADIGTNEIRLEGEGRDPLRVFIQDAQVRIRW